MHRFYCPDIATTFTLSEDESKHCVRVLRLAEGDTIEVIDGAGMLYTCYITIAHPKRCAIAISNSQHIPNHWRHRIVVGIAPTKHLDRMEWMVEKCVEIGIDRIIPLRCHNSERTVLKTERLQSIMIAAMKQSLKTTLPQLDELTTLDKLLSESIAGDRFIAYCDAELPRDQRLDFCKCYRPNTDTLVLIGPEGDFSPDEVTEALRRGFTPVTLGDSRLRTETAAIMAVASMHAIDMRNS